MCDIDHRAISRVDADCGCPGGDRDGFSVGPDCTYPPQPVDRRTRHVDLTGAMSVDRRKQPEMPTCPICEYPFTGGRCPGCGFEG